jgi:hypothetical protein
MSISSRQATKATTKIIESRMKEGYIPTIDYVNAKLGEFYATYSVGFPFFKNRKQPYRKIFDINSYNNNIEEIYEDINNLYEELISQFTTILADFDFYETERHQMLHRIMSLEDSLMDLSLAAGDIDGYIYSVHDSFIDRSKIDLEYSTCEINTDAGIVTLRESMSGIAKVDMSHYFDTVNFPILAESKYASTIISNTVFPSSKFGYAFSDISASWSQNIVTKAPGELQVSFIIDVSPSNEDGVYMTRVEISGQSPKPMVITPLYSLDNINFVALPMGYASSTKEVGVGRKTVWNFEELRIRYMKFLITKSVEDEQISVGGLPAYRYVIGIKHIGLFKMGYCNSSVLYSKAFKVADTTGESLTIDKASIVVDHDIPSGTSMRYYLSLGVDGESDPAQYSWIEVSPLNDSLQSVQKIVDFRHVAFFNNVPNISWNSGAYGTALESYYGIDFYKIYQFPYEPIRDSVVLYRGLSNWQVKPTYDVKRKAIYDEKHVFGASQTVTLTYPNFITVEGDGLIRGSVRVKSDPGQNPNYWNTVPGDYTVDYINHTINITTGSSISNDLGSSSNTVYVDYQYDEEVSMPTVYTSYIYVMNESGITINHIPFNIAEISAGQFTRVTTGNTEVDISSSISVYLSSGWHRISTTATPRSANDRFYTVNGNKYLHELVYQQFAFSDKLKEVSWFELKHNTLKTDHTKYAITDYDGDGNKDIVVNYRPQTAVFDIGSTPWVDMLCSDGNPETYVISYKYITTANDTIFLKADITRAADTPLNSTPTLRSYTIKLGY